jgi:hypothetical protein
MTSQEHNKTLGICHLVYGGLHTLMMLAMVGFFIFFAAVMPPDGPPPAFFLLFGVFFFIYSLIFTVPAFVAGYALLKRKPWARTASIVAAVLEAMNVPIGTAVCVYSFWFMFSDAGKQFYEQVARAGGAARGELHEATARPWWQDAVAQEREPVDQRASWRGE